MDVADNFVDCQLLQLINNSARQETVTEITLKRFGHKTLYKF